MNLILFKEEEPVGFLSSEDPRYIHIISVIKPKVGDSLDMGVLNSLRGKMHIKDISDKGLSFIFEATSESPELLPITLIIGTPRPPVAKRLLKDLSTQGVAKIIMCATDLGEKAYLTSKLWRDNKYLDYIYDGASQGESTLVPAVERFYSLKKSLESIPTDCDKLALDNISPDLSISDYSKGSSQVVVAIGGERGFSDRERELLRSFGYRIFSLGDRVLRTETACHRVLGAICSKL